VTHERSRREKLETMATQAASPAEAEVARILLERLYGDWARKKTPGILGRDDILGAPDVNLRYPNRAVRLRVGTVTFIVDRAELDDYWEKVHRIIEATGVDAEVEWLDSS